MSDFSSRLREAIERHDSQKSLRSLSVEAGLSPSFLANGFASGQFDGDRNGPGFFSVCRICEVIGTTPNHLAYGDALPRSINAPRPSSSAMMQAYYSGGGQLNAFKPHLDFCDLIDPPSSESPLNIVRVGRLGMAAMAMGCSDAKALNDAVKATIETSWVEKLLRDHQQAEANGYLVTIEEMDIRSTAIGKRIKADYVRSLFRVTDTGGRVYILNHADPLNTHL